MGCKSDSYNGACISETDIINIKNELDLVTRLLCSVTKKLANEDELSSHFNEINALEIWYEEHKKIEHKREEDELDRIKGKISPVELGILIKAIRNGKI